MSSVAQATIGWTAWPRHDSVSAREPLGSNAPKQDEWQLIWNKRCACAQNHLYAQAHIKRLEATVGWERFDTIGSVVYEDKSSACPTPFSPPSCQSIILILGSGVRRCRIQVGARDVCSTSSTEHQTVTPTVGGSTWRRRRVPRLVGASWAAGNLCFAVMAEVAGCAWPRLLPSRVAVQQIKLQQIKRNSMEETWRTD